MVPLGIISAILLCSSSSIISASSLSDLIPSSHRFYDRAAISDSPLAERDAKPFVLRIMPLGASITLGYKSKDGNGYRQYLRNALISAGWKVNMVGSVKSGSMCDNDNEGHIGLRVTEVAQQAEKTIPQKPNVILVNAGTNDAMQNFQVSTTGDRMNALLDRLFDAIPNTTIVLSSLIPNKLAPANVAQINEQYRQIFTTRQQEGQRIVLAEMHNGVLTTDDLQDNTHPSDGGYKKMASVWWTAINQAQAEGLLQEPADTGMSDEVNGTCQKNQNVQNGSTRGMVIQHTTLSILVAMYLIWEILQCF